MLWILIGYLFLYIHRPFEIWPSLADIHLERLYMAGTLLAALAYPGKRWVPNWQHAAYLAFALAVTVCWLASPWPASGEETVENYLKVLVCYVLIILVVKDERSLRRLLLAFLVIMAVYMLHSLREYFCGRHTFRMGIARLIGVDSTLGDPNSFGASIVYALPFVVPFWLSRPSRLLRVFLAGYVALSVICIGLTGSRSSFVGLLLCVAVVVLRSRWRVRLAAAAVVAAPLLWLALPAALQTRFETILYPEVGPANARTSAEGRIEGLLLGLELWEKNPATGCGPGAWRPATGRTIESHSLYGQLLGETGTLGAAAFAGILAGFWLNLRGVRRLYRAHPEWGRDFLSHVTGAIGLGVLLLLFEGGFGHNLFRYNWVWYGGFLVLVRACLRDRVKARAAVVRTFRQWQFPAAPARIAGYARR
jgi:hypothetical protein